MRRLLTVVGVLGLVATLGYVALPSNAADHLEAPLVQQDGRTDINDIYAFQSPTNPDNTVLVMTVNPVAGIQSPTTFRPGVSYTFMIDTDGDARRDIRYTARFNKPDADGQQRVRLTRAADGDTSLVAEGMTGGSSPISGGGQVFAGLSDDPFFFDLQAFKDQVKGEGGTRTFCDATPTDFFAGLDVSSIVVEVPSSSLGTNIGVWAQTRDNGGVIDRMGRPAIATVLINDGNEDAFNATRPVKDRATWLNEVKGNLLGLSGLDGTPYSDAEAQGISEVLLPDILTLDTSSSAGFLNGRQLQDDVIDAELGVVTGGFFGGSPVLTSDCVNSNNVPFLGAFPYVAPMNSGV
jgi:hypothetical protein